MDVKLEDLLVSYLQCRSNKRNTMAALQFEQDWESNLMELYRELCEDRYRVRHRTWLSARRECSLRIRKLKQQCPGKKFIFNEIYKDICMERYLKNRGGL